MDPFYFGVKQSNRYTLSHVVHLDGCGLCICFSWRVPLNSVMPLRILILDLHFLILQTITMRHNKEWFRFKQIVLVEEAIANNWNENVSIKFHLWLTKSVMATHPPSQCQFHDELNFSEAHLSSVNLLINRNRTSVILCWTNRVLNCFSLK